MKALHHESWLLLAVAVAVGLLAGYQLANVIAPSRPAAVEMEMRGDWIKSSEPSYCGCFRKTIWLPDTVRNAWIAVAAADGFELFVNGASVGRNVISRPSRPFEFGLSETGQSQSTAPPLLGFRFPREFQWSGNRSDRLPIYLDLTPFFAPGRNSLCIEVRSRVAPARVRFEGEILLSSGKHLPFQSDCDWKCETIPPDGDSLNWKRAGFFDESWRRAVPANVERVALFRTIDPTMFTTPFAGDWICSPKRRERGTRQAVFFATSWQLNTLPKDAWLRIASTEPYNLLVNGFPVLPHVSSVDAQGEAGWVLSKLRTVEAGPSDEVVPQGAESGTISNIAGRSISEISAGGALRETGINLITQANPTEDAADTVSIVTLPAQPSLVMVPGQTPGFGVGSTSSDQSRRSQIAGSLRQSSRGVINIYDIQAMLRNGSNKIEIRLPSVDDVSTVFPEIAVDGAAQAESGRYSPLPPSSTWETHVGNGTDSGTPVVVHSGAAIGRFHRKHFCGSAWNLPGTGRTGAWIATLSVIVSIAGALIAALSSHAVRSSREVPELRRTAIGHLRNVRAAFLPAAVVLFVGVLIQWSLEEREEALMVSTTAFAAWMLFLAGVASPILWLVGRSSFKWNFQRRVAGSIARFFGTRMAGNLPLLTLLTLCGLLRVGDIAFQPVDDDEYASVQAVLSIADTGLPAYADGIYYTRSPLYHYLAGAFVHLLGAHLWALRLPSMAFGIATAALIYRFGVRLLGAKWIGIGAAILYALHPFAIYTAHYARFYQQQQFFALLTVYYFFRGFVTEQTPRSRYLTIAAFIIAIFSQELTLVMGVPMAIGYIVYAQRKSWASELRFFAVCCCVLLLVTVDIFIFQTRCLTRLEGISSNVEATFGLNFENPLYMLATFLGHSRLHLALSILLLCGLPFALRRRCPVVGALHFMLFGGALVTHILIIGAGARYQYWLLPIWLLLGLYNANALVRAVCGGRRIPSLALWRPVFPAALFFAVVISFSPWRIFGSYDTKILGDSSGALSYVRQEKRPGDAIAITNPHTHAALLELGQVDFDIEIPLKYDYIYRKNGELIDRNAGAAVISTPDHLWNACANRDRLWILVNKEKMLASSNSDLLNWSFPGARFESFLRENCRLQFQTYCWDVYLWDRRNGRLMGFRRSL